MVLELPVVISHEIVAKAHVVPDSPFRQKGSRRRTKLLDAPDRSSYAAQSHTRTLSRRFATPRRLPCAWAEIHSLRLQKQAAIRGFPEGMSPSLCCIIRLWMWRLALPAASPLAAPPV